MEAAPHPADRRRWFGLAALSLGISMVIVDATVVNVAVPTIIRDLGISSATAEWINAIYALVFAALLISVGRAGDLYGRRRLFLIGVVVFLAASVLAAAASTGAHLIAARVLQGVGAAAILPASLSTVNATFRGRERAIAFGVWGSVIGGMAAVGPLIGGWLTTDASWRWAFLINLPVGIVVVAATLWAVRETRDPAAKRGHDIVGVLTTAVGFGLLVFGLIEGRIYGWWAPEEPFTVLGWEWPLSGISPVPVAFAIAIGCLVTLVIVERRRAAAGRAVVLDLSLFRIRTFRTGNASALIVSLGEFGLLFVLPLFLQSVLGYSAKSTGVLLLALAGGAFCAGGIAAPASQRFGARRVVALGMALETVGIAGIGLFLSTHVSGWQLAPALFVYGLGVGLATAQLTNVILADVPPALSGQASGTQSTARQVGSALGIAILGTVLITGLESGTRERLARLPGLPAAEQARLADAVQQTAGAVVVGLRDRPKLAPAVAAIDDAFVSSAKTTAFVAAIFVFLGFLLSLRLPAGRSPPS